jgi:hypothetical protein
MRVSAPSSVPAHWSRDFVEHLRTVHFALIAVSAGLILLVLSSKPYSPAIALRQIEEIIELQKEWSPSWLIESLKVERPVEPARNLLWAGQGAGQGGYPNLTLGPDRRNLRFLGTYAKRHSNQKPQTYIFVFPEAMWRVDEPHDSEGLHPDQWILDRFPKTLSSFKRWWDSLRTILIVDIPGDISTVGVVGFLDEPESEDRYAVLTGQEASASEAALDRVALEYTGLTDVHDGAGFIGRLDNERLFFATYDDRRVRLSQEALNSYFENWRPGSFEKSFSDLAKASRTFNALEFDDIKKLISDDAAKGAEVFEAFGMKFPAGQITLWGTIVLLSVQLYLLTYLRLLSGKLRPGDAGWDVPWIGIGQSTLAQLIFFVTLVLLPSFSIGLLDGRALWQLVADRWDQTGNFWHLTGELGLWNTWVVLKILSLAIAFIAAVILAVRSWKDRPRLSQ